MSHRATLKDVAARAGVSPTTVSLFINGHETVCSRDTAERIRSAVSELNYRKGRSGHRPGIGLGLPVGNGGVATLTPTHSFATAMGSAPPLMQGNGMLNYAPGINRSPHLTGISRTIGIGFSPACNLLDPNDSEPTHLASLVWQGASQVTDWDGCRLLTYPLDARRSSEIVSFLDGAASGVILIPGNEDPRPARLAQAGLPVMLLGRSENIPDGVGSVYALERDTVDLAMGHLWEMGHRRIAHYAGPVGYAAQGGSNGVHVNGAYSNGHNGVTGNYYDALSYSPSEAAQQRLARYQSWMRMHGMETAGLNIEALVYTENNWHGDHAEEALDAWLALPAEQRPTAVFCASDSLALRLMDAAAARGISIPGELSIVGVDDSLEARNATVPLTSVVMPALQIGREAARLLLRMLEGWPAASCRIAVPVTQIAARASSAAPK